MPINEENKYGQITIYESVLRNITIKTIQNFYKYENIYSEKMEKEIGRNIRITINEDGSISMFLKIPAKYGKNLVEFSRRLQNQIKDELEKMSEIFVTNIDVEIKNLVHEDSEEEELVTSTEEEDSETGTGEENTDEEDTEKQEEEQKNEEQKKQNKESQ